MTKALMAQSLYDTNFQLCCIYLVINLYNYATKCKYFRKFDRRTFFLQFIVETSISLKMNHDNHFSIQSFQIHIIELGVHSYLEANSLYCRLQWKITKSPQSLHVLLSWSSPSFHPLMHRDFCLQMATLHPWIIFQILQTLQLSLLVLQVIYYHGHFQLHKLTFHPNDYRN